MENTTENLFYPLGIKNLLPVRFGKFLACSFVEDGTFSELGFKAVTRDSKGDPESWPESTSKNIKTYTDTSQTSPAAQSAFPIFPPYVEYVQNNHCFANKLLILLLPVAFWSYEEAREQHIVSLNPQRLPHPCSGLMGNSKDLVLRFQKEQRPRYPDFESQVRIKL